MASGEPAGGLNDGEGSRADAMENRSGIERVRPLPIRGSCRNTMHQGVQRRPVVNGEAPRVIGPGLELHGCAAQSYDWGLAPGSNGCSHRVGGREDAGELASRWQGGRLYRPGGSTGQPVEHEATLDKEPERE